MALAQFLLVEAANIAVRFDPELRKEYLHRCIRNTSPSPRWQRLIACDTDVLDASYADTVSTGSFIEGNLEMYSGQHRQNRQAE